MNPTQLAAPQWQIRARKVQVVEPRFVRADDRKHFRALVGQHATCERPRANALELDDFQADERTNHSEVLASWSSSERLSLAGIVLDV